MILKGVFTKGRHEGKPITHPDVTANYLRMILWQDLGDRIEEIVRVELTRRGEVHFDATYNQEYRANRRREKIREKVQEMREKAGTGTGGQSSGSRSWTPPRSSPAPSGLPVDRNLLAEIVRAGRQALAKRHHPDVGGDAEKMRQINAAADALLEWAGK